MTPLWLRQLDAQLRTFLPFLTAVAAVVLDQLPLPVAGGQSAASFMTLGAAYFWSLYRPDLFSPITAFVVGLLHDALTGLPPGATSLVLLLVREVMVGQQRFFLARPFPVVWACFALLATAAVLARWALVCLWWAHVFALPPVLFELIVTLALYAPVSWVLGRIHNHVPRVIYAP